MKIILLIGSLTNGGAERITLLLAHHWAALGHDVVLVTIDSGRQDFYALDSTVRRIRFESAGNSLLEKITTNLKSLIRMRSLIKEFQPDVIVAMMTPNVVIGILSSLGFPVRVYGSERNFPGKQKINPVWAVLRRLIYRFADGHIAQTKKTAIWLEKATSVRNVRVIPNPVVWPLEDLPPKISPESVVMAKRKILLAVGTKPAQKGFDLLVQAFSNLVSAYLDWDLVILGIDPESDAKIGGGASIRHLGWRLGIAHRLFLPGVVGNTKNWYQRADLFVLSSRYEGMPNVLLEAMASGCPSIAFSCDTGPEDIIQNRVNGILVPPEDIRALSIGLATLMGNESLRMTYGKRGVEVREKFAMDKIVKLWGEATGVASI